MHVQQNNRFSSQNICKILVHAGLISPDQAKDLLRREKGVKESLYNAGKNTVYKGLSRQEAMARMTLIDVMVHLGLKCVNQPGAVLDEDMIYRALADAWKLVYKKVDPLKLDLNLVTGFISKAFAFKHLLLPVSVESGKLVVATPDPFNFEAIKDVEMVSKLKVVAVLSSKTDIEKLIQEFFGFRYSISAAQDLFSGKGVDLGNLERFVTLTSQDDLPPTDQHIVNAVNHLFTYSFDQKASDIHIEPKRDICLVRMRIDGALHTVYKLPKQLHNAVISRIKTLSGLDMAEKRRPQDGRIKMAKENTEVEIRVSTIPVAFGEKVVMRIMDPDILFQDLEKLGFSKEDFTKYKKLITLPFGIVLVTGPTGSGKSTTLYSSLRMLSSAEVNITTIEDPIEMIHEEFNQISVQPAVNVTFGSVLRNIMRQDPDIIMVGEIRDLETAQAAVQAALTGHLVLSTLHTNDSVSAVFRLLDLGIPPYLVHASLNGIAAQRLVRRICPHCVQTIEMDAKELAELGLVVAKSGAIRLCHGKGCNKCRGTGYKGRIGIYEILPYTESLKKLSSPDGSLKAMREKAKAQGLVLLRQNGIKKMLQGETTYQEILRITWDQF
ncbi:MAG: Flp pilus assembly complex ATPase component TadA [Desulfobacteraceae bacterium]|nr:Flp pilus assembly complex ATPase component TadA [Desulfobacteraceae bacterium]